MLQVRSVAFAGGSNDSSARNGALAKKTSSAHQPHQVALDRLVKVGAVPLVSFVLFHDFGDNMRFSSCFGASSEHF